MIPESEKNGCFLVAEAEEDLRLDSFLASRPLNLSRSRIQSLIKTGHVKINNAPSKASYRVKAGDLVTISIPPPSPLEIEPEAVDFEVVHEDESLLVLNKPPGVVVHPAPGHSTGTLVHGLLRHCRGLSGIGGVLRPGIVHRLDKDTSGLMVVAKTDRAHSFLAGQFKAGEVKKEYLALVHGHVKGEKGQIDLPIGRHPIKRKEMAVAPERGKRALTLWRKLEDFSSGFSLLSVDIKTGRTHQIRVHLSHVGHPVVGDTVYGHGRSWWKSQALYRKGLLGGVDRQMLHAKRLSFFHPDLARIVAYEAPVPTDFSTILRLLRDLETCPPGDKCLDIGKKLTINKIV